jgi:hypothetical protein
MNMSKAVAPLELTQVCWGGCGISVHRHRYGTIDGFGIIHFDDRGFTRKGARNLLLLVARRERESDPQWLNIELYDWYYQYVDSVRAYQLALDAGFRLPGRLFNEQREQCRALALSRGVRLSRYQGVRAWLKRRN